MTDVYFDSGLEGWIKRTAREQYWRINNWHDWYSVDDLVQDGYLCYLRCRNKYVLQPPDPGRASKSHPSLVGKTEPTEDQRKHFMVILKRAFWNHIHTLAHESSLLKEEIVESLDGGDELALFENILPPQPEEASVIAAITNAPAEISAAVDRLIKDGIDGGKFLRTRLVPRGNRIVRSRRAIRETTRERLERLLGDLPRDGGPREQTLAEATIAYICS